MGILVLSLAVVFQGFQQKVVFAFLAIVNILFFKKIDFGCILFGISINMLRPQDEKCLLLEEGFLLWSQWVVRGGGWNTNHEKKLSKSQYL